MLGGIVRGRRAVLRTPTEDDLGGYDRWLADLRVRRLARAWSEPAARATWKERFAKVAKDRRRVLWSIDAGGELAGFARFTAGHDWNPFGGIASLDDLVIDPDKWRRGLGFDAALALHRYAFDYLGVRTVEAAFAADNEGALRIARRLGCTEFARGHDVHYRDGAYVDELRVRFDREAWAERWAATEREYEPLPAGLPR